MHLFFFLMCNPIQWSSEIILEAIQLLLCCTGFLVKHIKCSSGEGEVSTSTVQMEFLIHLGEMGGDKERWEFCMHIASVKCLYPISISVI